MSIPFLPVRLSLSRADGSSIPLGGWDEWEIWFRPRCSFCKMCYNFEDDALRTRVSPELCSDLFRSANNGCYKCQILKIVIESLCAGDPNKTMFMFTVNIERNKEDKLRSFPELRVWDIGGQYMNDIDLYRIVDGPCPWKFLEVKLNVPEGTASSASFSWVQEQMKRCLSGHPQCSIGWESPILPTRVLDVRLNLASNNNTVRVVETNGSRGNYLALSHCWGNPELMPTKLTAHTLKDYQDSIPYDSLPPTFQDAVTFTRMMNIQYLWIDSLCIIQCDREKDSPEDEELSRRDWIRESDAMCSVFENSYLTLAAASSPGCTSGLFSSTKTTEIRGTNVDGPYQIYARKQPNHKAEGFPLFKRGWVMQESLLAPRTLLFGDSELIWLCRGHKACQCSTSVIGGLDQSSEWYMKLPKVDQLNDESVRHAVMKSWYRLITNYSTTSLTHETDKLAAVDGIVQYMRRLRSGEYRAGLWSDSLPLDLLWSTFQASRQPWRTARRNLSQKTPWSSDKLLFPTWSWASIRGQVSWPIEDLTENCPEEEILVDLIEERPTDAQDHSLICPAYELNLYGVVVPSSLGALPQGHMRGRGVYYPDWDNQLSDLGSKTKIACLRVLKSYNEYYSLVLHCVDEDKSVYERIGLLFYRDNLHCSNTDIDDREWKRESEIKGLPPWWEVCKGWEPNKVTVTLV
ncbi:HET-domain-containing protein [Hypoxylon sp. NC0597]|nr:HET-domain-containing protein [Hypoxylon sp. NC0597]